MSPKYAIEIPGIPNISDLIVIWQENPNLSYLTADLLGLDGQSVPVISHFDYIPAERFADVLADLGIVLGELVDLDPEVKVNY